VSSPSLLELLDSVPDPRDPRGRIHPLSAVLSLAVVALLAGKQSLEAIAQFGRDHGAALAFALGFRRKKTPTKSTFCELFQVLDLDAFEAVLRTWMQSVERDGDAVALDGKTLKGSRNGEIPGIHLLAAFVPHSSAVLGQLRVDSKTNEHKAALRLLKVLPVQGKVVTGDAMFTHRDFAQAVRDGGGDYLLVVKDNQPELKGQIQAALHDDAAFSPLSTQAKNSGRTGGTHRRQRTRSSRGAAVTQHDGAEPVSGLAVGRSGV
jgi:predicted transposase YbfD/YdcC